MDNWTFVVEYLNGSAVWVLVLAFVAVVVGVAIKRVAEQPYFGGRKHMESLEEHYIHGEMTRAGSTRAHPPFKLHTAT